MSRWSSFLFVALTFAAPAYAQVTPVIFERVDIRIDPAIPEGETEIREASDYNVEVRSEDALKLEYIHTLNMLNADTGAMLLFQAPTMIGLPNWKVYTPVDALFVAENGMILQILPHTVLGELEQEIIAKEPVKAFLFLADGQVAARKLKPRDVIAGPMFAPAPAIMN